MYLVVTVFVPAGSRVARSSAILRAKQTKALRESYTYVRKSQKLVTTSPIERGRPALRPWPTHHIWTTQRTTLLQTYSCELW